MAQFTNSPGTGRVIRIRDPNNDGAGEASVMLTASSQPFSSPASIVFGPGGGSAFGSDLYLLNYSRSTSLRFVYRVANDPNTTVSRFSNAPFFNPEGMRFTVMAIICCDSRIR